MVVLAFLTDARVVARILTHLGLPTAPPALAPARDPFDAATPEDAASSSDSDPSPDDWDQRPQSPSGRAPPTRKR